MTTAEVKSVWWACITWPHKSAKLSLSSLLLGGANAKKKRQLLIHLDCLCSVFLPISVFLRTRFMMSFAKDKGLSPNAAALKPVSKQWHLRQNFWAQIIFDPHRRPLTLTFLHVSTRGLFQDTMFDRLRKQHVIRGNFRSSSATASLRHREGNLCGSCGRKTYPETV